MWFFCKSFNLAVHFSRQLSWRHNNLPKSKLQTLNVEVDRVSQLFVTLPLSMPAPPWHLLSERAGCSASSRVFEYHFLTQHEPPATCCTLSHIGHNGRRDVALSGANVSVSALPRLCTARLSEHHYGLQHGSTTSAFCYWDTALQKESQTWRSRKPGTETLMETSHHLVCSTDCTETTEKLLSIKNHLNNLAMKL